MTGKRRTGEEQDFFGREEDYLSGEEEFFGRREEFFSRGEDYLSGEEKELFGRKEEISLVEKRITSVAKRIPLTEQRITTVGKTTTRAYQWCQPKKSNSSNSLTTYSMFFAPLQRMQNPLRVLLLPVKPSNTLKGSY
ncbi:unnamed protein product [Calypogeia fissa]